MPAVSGVAAAAKLDGAAWLAQGALAQLLAVLGRDGEEARVVGGAVRNHLLQLPVQEVDVATTALPAEVARRVAAAGWRAVPTGVAHGTVTVVIFGQPFEVTTLREDVETFGRKARVRFGRDWRVDAARRDFTINALSAAADGSLFDYVGGLADLAQRRVRFIGDPHQRIGEDYLRILRFFRFHAQFGQGPPDAAGLAACIAQRAGLANLSRERVRNELLKLLIAPGAAGTIAVMASGGLLGPLLGGVPYSGSFARLVEIESALGLAADPVRRLGALAVMVREDGERVSARLRLSKAQSERLMALEGWWRLDANVSAQAARALLYALGPQAFVDRVLIGWARGSARASEAAWRALAELPQHWTAPDFPLKSADFTRRGVPAGKALGEALRAARSAWIAADFPADQAALAAIADAAARTAS